jgi:hypothetical protein
MTLRTTRMRWLAPSSAVCIFICTLPLSANAASTHARPEVLSQSEETLTGPAVVAQGLHNPRGITVGRRGTVYVAESGTGGPTCVGRDGSSCYGTTGSITAIEKDGEIRRVVNGLPSSAAPDGSSASGPTDVIAMPDGSLALTIGGAGPGVPRAGVQRQAATVVLVRPGHQPRVLADLQQFAEEHPQPGRDPEANPYGLSYRHGEIAVTDASENSVLTIDRAGRVSLLARIPSVRVDGKAVDSVPTAVTPAGRSGWYVGELTGYPYPTGKSRVWLVQSGKPPQVRSRGLSVVMDVAPDGRGGVLVLQLAPTSLLDYTTTLPSGVLYDYGCDGRRTLLANQGLAGATGVAAAPDAHSVYIVTNGLSSDAGQVLRVPWQGDEQASR